MNCKIIVLNIMKYIKKKDNTPMTKIQFAFADIQNSKSYKGVNVIDSYYKGHEVYEKLSTKDLILKPCNAEFKVFNDYYNPLAERKLLTKINDIDLL